jgi:hypothetical protein
LLPFSAGWSAFEFGETHGIGALFKDVKIDFHRRVDNDLHIVCEDVQKIRGAAEQAVSTKKRVNVVVDVKGYVYEYSREKPCVTSQLTLSLKLLHK